MFAAWSWIDYVIIAIIVLSILTGLFRGFFKELIALCVWILAIWCGLTYAQFISTQWLAPHIQDKTACLALAFVLIIVCVLLAGGLVNALLSFLLHRTGLSGTDRILGMGFGFTRGVFIVALLMLIVKMTALPYQQYMEKSYLYAKFDPVVNWLYGMAPNFIKQMQSIEGNKEPELELRPN